jgi:iron-sulfur cluster insertion protein
MNPAIKVTSSAVRKIRLLMRDMGDLGLMLRAYVTGGGCQGLQYGFALEACQEPDDLHLRFGFDDLGHSQVAAFLCMLCECVDRQGKEGLFSGPIFPYIGVLVDPISLPYLHEAVVDYVVDGHGERFVVKNPNAKTTCGCDRSFTAA